MNLSPNEISKRGEAENLSNSSLDRKNVVISAFAMASGTLFSRILGLIRDMALAALFSRGVTDAWTAAFRLPNLFRRILGEGSLSVSFIPVFIEAQEFDRQTLPLQGEGGSFSIQSGQAHNLINGLYTFLLIVGSVLTGLGIIFAEPLLWLMLDSSYTADPVRMQMTLRMAQIMFGFVFLIFQYAFFMGILNALGQFSLPALAPVFFNISMIISTVLPIHWFPNEGDALAWGVTLGGFIQVAVLVPALKNRGYLPTFSLKPLSSQAKQVLKIMIPGALGAGLLQMMNLVNLYYASGLAIGSISSIYWADRLLELPISLIAVSLGTALLPTLSKQFGENKKQQMLETSADYLRLSFFLSIPAALGLYVLAEPIVEVLFKRGQFNGEDMVRTASILKIYAGTLVAACSIRVLIPLYYAVKNTQWPLMASIISLLLHLGLAQKMVATSGLKGLLVSSLIAAYFSLFLIIIGIPFFIGKYQWKEIFLSLSKTLLSALIMASLISLIQTQWILNFSLLSTESGFYRIILLFTLVTVGVFCFVCMNFLFRSSELRVLIETLRKKIKRLP